MGALAIAQLRVPRQHALANPDLLDRARLWGTAVWARCAVRRHNGFGAGRLIGRHEHRFVEINNAILDDVASRLDLAQLHDRYVQ